MKKMYDEATRKRWQEATCKAIKDGEDHARLLHNIIKRCRERYGSLLKKFLSVNEELRTTKRALWLARAEVARISAQNWANSINTLTYYCGKFDNKEIESREMMEKWEWVERKCRAKAEEYL